MYFIFTYLWLWLHFTYIKQMWNLIKMYTLYIKINEHDYNKSKSPYLTKWCLVIFCSINLLVIVYLQTPNYNIYSNVGEPNCGSVHLKSSNFPFHTCLDLTVDHFCRCLWAGSWVNCAELFRIWDRHSGIWLNGCCTVSEALDYAFINTRIVHVLKFVVELNTRWCSKGNCVLSYSFMASLHISKVHFRVSYSINLKHLCTLSTVITQLW